MLVEKVVLEVRSDSEAPKKKSNSWLNNGSLRGSRDWGRAPWRLDRQLSFYPRPWTAVRVTRHIHVDFLKSTFTFQYD